MGSLIDDAPFGASASMWRASSAARSGDITSPDSASHTTPPMARA